MIIIRFIFLSNHQEIKDLKNRKNNQLLNLNLITDTDPAFDQSQMESIMGHFILPNGVSLFNDN